MKSFALFLLSAFAVHANVALVQEEASYLKIQEGLLGKTPAASSMFFLLAEPKLTIDVVEDLSVVEGTRNRAIELLGGINALDLPREEGLRVELLRLRLGVGSLNQVVALEEMITGELSIRMKLILGAFRDELKSVGLEKNVPDSAGIANVATAEMVADLFNSPKDLSRFAQGKFKGGALVFLLCRTNRSYPCLMVMKDAAQRAVLRPDGSLWSQPSLASAVTGLPPTQRNGHTPAGVFLMDSVMPYADQQLSYGKFRRVMLDFAPQSLDEKILKQLLPPTSHDATWWQQSVIARDVGRNLFRVHGTGRINRDPSSTFYPLTQTHGCISKRENSYDGVTYTDQRDFLDVLMTSTGLDPVFANEPKIKGILYVVEIGDEERAVTIEDLPGLGITAGP